MNKIYDLLNFCTTPAQRGVGVVLRGGGGGCQYQNDHPLRRPIPILIPGLSPHKQSEKLAYKMSSKKFKTLQNNIVT